MRSAGLACSDGRMPGPAGRTKGIGIVHEAGLADAIAAEIRERGLDARSVRLEVTGGHGDVEAFDAALRLHLSLALPGVDATAIAIDHRATRLCPACGVATGSGGGDGPCPTCGGPAVALPTPEQVVIGLASGTVGTA